MVIAIFLLILFFAFPAHAQQLNPGGGLVVQGGPTNAVFPPGPVSITGNAGNGTDTITGIANLNGEMWANNFTGADMGAKINNAIAALPIGGVVRIPAGKYQFSTTIQCPNTDAQIIIQGSGQTVVGDSNPTWYNQGTLLQYTGNTDAINQVLPAAQQNYIGCVLRDLTLDGSLAGINAVGFHFGGTQLSGTDDVAFASFPRAAIELENVVPGPSGFAAGWTERWHFNNTAIYRNPNIGIWFKSDYTGVAPSVGWSSFAHGHMNIWLNATGSSTGIKVEGSGNVYGSEVVVNGNVELNTATVVTLANNASFEQNWFVLDAECMQNSCIRFNVDATSMGGFDGSGLQQGQFHDVIAAGGTLVESLLNMGNPQYPGGIYTSGTVYPQSTPQAQYASNANPNWFQEGSINTSNNTYSIASGSHSRIFWDCSGLILVSENTGNDKGLYMCGGNICNFIGSSQSTFAHIWAASSAVPAAGTASVAWNNATGGYDIYNNTGTTRTFAVMSLINEVGE